jgi:hypothetical protein
VAKRASHDVALELRDAVAGAGFARRGTSLKTVEPPPGPPVMATLLAEVYGPTPRPPRNGAANCARCSRAWISSSMWMTVSAAPPRRLRALISPDDLEFFSVQEQDVFDTIAILNGETVVGYSHREDGRRPIPITVARDRSDKVMDERFLSTPIPANVLPGARGVVELGDVLRIEEEQ